MDEKSASEYQKEYDEAKVKTPDYVSDKATILSDPKRYLLDKDIDKPGQLLPYIQNEQAFLMDFMAFTHNKVDESKFQKNLITVLQDESNEQFINKACTVDGFEELFSLNSSQKARLVPTIRIYKQFYKGNTITDEEEFVFDNFTDLSNIQQITQDRLFRGAACGIKNLKIDSDAKNPATGQFVVASLDILFNDVQQIFADTTLSSGKQISYSDLFSFPTKENENFFQIKMLVGWAGAGDVFERLNIQYCKMILQLYLRSYSIDLREDGQAVLKIEYNGAIENILYDGQSSNLIKISKSAQDKLEETKTKLKIYEDTQKRTEKKIDEIVKSENQDSKVFGVTIQSKEEKRAKTKEESLKGFKDETEQTKNEIKNLILNQKVIGLQQLFSDPRYLYSVELSKEDLDKYITFLSKNDIAISQDDPEYDSKKDSKTLEMYEVFENAEVKKQNDEKIVSDSTQKEAQRLKNVENNKDADWLDVGMGAMRLNESIKQELATQLLEKKHFTFIYFGDLLDLLSGYIKEQIMSKYKQEIEIKLGNIIITPPLLNMPVEMSISKIPISIQLLNNFFVDRILGKSNEVYTLGQFIDDMMNDVLVKTMQEAQKIKPTFTNKNNFNLITMPVYKTRNNVYTTVSDESSSTKLCLFMYSTTKNLNNISDNYLTNVKNRIPHFYFTGIDRGIVKSIKFTDNTSQKFTMAIYENSKETNNQLDSTKKDGIIQPKIYKVSIKTFGFPFFTCGQVIFIDTSLIGINNNAKGRSIYIGGIYTVVKVSHDLSKDTFDTSIEAIFEAPYDENKKDNIKLYDESDWESRPMANIRRIAN